MRVQGFRVEGFLVPGFSVVGFQGLWVKVSGFRILGCWGSYGDLIIKGWVPKSFVFLLTLNHLILQNSFEDPKPA